MTIPFNQPILKRFVFGIINPKKKKKKKAERIKLMSSF